MRTLALSFALLAAACSERSPGMTELPTTDDGNFTLYVSNQSFDIDPVDIDIRIDGRLAVSDEFYVEGQHSWHTFKFALGTGSHRITARSDLGAAALDESFLVEGDHWAVVDFWYYGPSHYEPTPQQFSFLISDEPIYFE